MTMPLNKDTLRLFSGTSWRYARGSENVTNASYGIPIGMRRSWSGTCLIRQRPRCMYKMSEPCGLLKNWFTSRTTTTGNRKFLSLQQATYNSELNNISGSDVRNVVLLICSLHGFLIKNLDMCTLTQFNFVSTLRQTTCLASLQVRFGF